LTEEDLEEITKEWSIDLRVPVDPVKLSDIENIEATHYTPGPRKTKKNEEAQDVHSTLTKTASISPEKGGDDEEIDGMEVQQKKGEFAPPIDEEYPSKKRKVSPSKPSSRKKSKATRTKFETTLTSDGFDLIFVTLNDALLEIEENKEAMSEEVFSRIKVELQ
jgi:hypothetical protein